MGSRPGLAEYIASFEAANNAPHSLVMLIAGAAYAIQALGDALAARTVDRTPSPTGTPGRRRRRPLRRRPPVSGES